MKKSEAQRVRLTHLTASRTPAMKRDNNARQQRKRTAIIAAAERRAKRARDEQQRRVDKQGVKPVIDVRLATAFAQLLASGAPADVAMRYLAPKYYARAKNKERLAWLNELSSSELVLDAVHALQGGEWHTLEPDRRLELALSKHLAELAHLLYTYSYTHADEMLQKKMDKAADRLTAYLTDSADDDDSPWKKFAEDFMQQYREDVKNNATQTPAALPIKSTIES